MASYSVVLAPRDDVFTKASAQPDAPTRRGMFRRFLDAVMESRQRQADREIARFLQTRGGKLTDEAEREIERRFLRHSSGQF